MKRTVAPAEIRRLMRILKRNVRRTPSSSPFPWNCAEKIPAPDTAPNMHSEKTKTSCPETETPVISAVPIRPTMRLSSIFTKFVIPF